MKNVITLVVAAALFFGSVSQPAAVITLKGLTRW